MKLYIKNMVCSRCKMVVRSELEKAGLQVLGVELGEVEIKNPPTNLQQMKLTASLKQLGFELIDDQKSRLIEQIKTTIIGQVHYADAPAPLKLSAILADKLNYDYGYLSNLFSEVEGSTIEKYYINQRTEKVKELLVYNELSLSQIAFQLGYSSVAYLSSQFKQVTGMTPSAFKKLQGNKRKNIEDL
ncbi:helix-turn-helix domain-containing protein [Mucilaginibacter ginsenosidivorax]|uniref:Helix-turn-helix transcriptional regulator n=1 Tax=Mucilaginibacter ginsenosidivorax TaxID=862126 RepID=A0A5B8VZ97_9SPHI|nr:AraC family transcriptional regulator [Mucilaginibacter ginsenosidivorax]QEC76814.1 helix-turn-helix transcriptional regulator [Mucilaginibacter ginsenosidivorax]